MKEHSLKTIDLKGQEEICTRFMRQYNIAIIHVNRVSVINFSRLLANYGHHNYHWGKAPRGFVVSVCIEFV
jgi:hypothetical protein